MKIAGIPKEFKAFFNRFRDLFSKKQFFYFSIYLYGLIVMPKQQKNVTQISQAWMEPLCRSSLEKLLCEVRWDFEKVLQRARTQLMRHLTHYPKAKRSMTLVIDDTDLDKYGESVFGAGWYKRRKEELPWKALQLVVLGVLIGDWLIPLDFRIYAQERVCQLIPMRFESKLTMARKMLKKLKLPGEWGVEVLFDSWYLSPVVVEAIEERGWLWCFRCRRNRNIHWEASEKEEAEKTRLDRYAEGISWEPLDYKTKRKSRAIVGHQRIGELKGVGRVKVVITSLKTKGEDKLAFFCTNQTKIKMVELLQKYERRWKIEVYFRESRAYLALEHWYFRDVASVVHHLCLSLLAMITCACLRLEQKKTNENFGTLGDFVRGVLSQNQRAVLHCFLVQWRLEALSPEEERKFNELCESLGF
jgi:SRSO17 transposase